MKDPEIHRGGARPSLRSGSPNRPLPNIPFHDALAIETHRRQQARQRYINDLGALTLFCMQGRPELAEPVKDRVRRHADMFRQVVFSDARIMANTEAVGRFIELFKDDEDTQAKITDEANKAATSFVTTGEPQRPKLTHPDIIDD